MKVSKSEKILELLVLIALTTTTLFMAPWSVTHPYSVPKLIPLVSFSLPILPILFNIIFTNKKILKEYKVILVLLFTHFLVSILILINHKNNTTQELYGIWGRNNGFISHVCFIILMWASLFYPIKTSLKIFVKLSISIGLISLVYGILQYLKLVKISKIAGENTQSVGFWGNENFYSAFMGMISVICLSVALDKNSTRLRKIFLFLASILGNLGIYLANSQQGFLVFAVGAIVVIFTYIKSSKFNKLTKPFFISSAIGLFTVILGFLQIGPLTKFVYEETLTFRGYYWKSGIKIFLDNPILGVGFDSYRDFYRRYRNPNALGSLPATDIADSSHNNFIDIAVNGGLALLITYLLIFFYVFRCAIKLIKEMHDFDAMKVAVIAAWFAFNTQTFVSLPQPGLTLWGWVLSGLVIAIYKQKNYEKSEQYWKNDRSPNYMLILILFLIGLVITIPPFRASAEYRKAIETQNISTLIHAANMFPQDATMLAAAGGALIGLDQFVEARKILNISIEKFPQYYESWYIYSLLPNLTEEEKMRIYEKMSELEPLLNNSYVTQ